MKISVFNSTLSCIAKCIRFYSVMANKKIILGLFIFCFTGACTSPTVMLGPAYTLSSTGSIYQSGLTYGYNEMITMHTGKTPIENIQEFTLNKKKNIKKKTLESKDFIILIKNRVSKASTILKTSNQ